MTVPFQFMAVPWAVQGNAMYGSPMAVAWQVGADAVAVPWQSVAVPWHCFGKIKKTENVHRRTPPEKPFVLPAA